MNFSFKFFQFLSIVIVMIVAVSCKKSTASYDFRDKIAGQYYGSNHNLEEGTNPDSSGNWLYLDSISGYQTISVTKLNSDKNTIIVNGDTFSMLIQNDSNRVYYLGNNVQSHGKTVTFNLHTDSLNYQFALSTSGNNNYYRFFTGKKSQ